MERSSAPIFTVAVGTVFSGLFHVLQGGKKRFATPNIKLIFHRATIYVEGDDRGMNAEDFREFSELLSMFDAMQALAFCKHGGLYEDMIELLREEAEFSPKEALKLKLIDAIVEGKDFGAVRKKILKNLARDKEKSA